MTDKPPGPVNSGRKGELRSAAGFVHDLLRSLLRVQSRPIVVVSLQFCMFSNPPGALSVCKMTKLNHGLLNQTKKDMNEMHAREHTDVNVCGLDVI